MSRVVSDVPSVPAPEPDLTPRELVARAEALVPMLRAQQDDAEQRGYYSEAVHRAFLDAGLYRITQPRRFGGYEFDLKTYLRAMIAIASGDPGTGWCLQLGSSHAWIVASHFDPETQAEAFGPAGDFRCPHPAQPSGRLERVDGGFRLSGRFPYASGIPYATWALLGAMLAGDPPTPYTVLVPRSDLTMLDDWGAGVMFGLNSSGSNTIVVEEAFVPDRRAIPSERFFNPLTFCGARRSQNAASPRTATSSALATISARPAPGSVTVPLAAPSEVMTKSPFTARPSVPRA